MAERNGQRKNRERLTNRRIPRLGYYLIVTDTKRTEENYVYGLRDSIPKELQGRLVIKVCKTKTIELVEEAIRSASMHPQYCEPWIVFDKDQINDFDKIIAKAKKEGINVGWSNPCIEIWFHAYFGEMPTCQDSVKCCGEFSLKFERVTGQKYKKSNHNIYSNLVCFGDEKNAILLAERKTAEHENNCNVTPSKMVPCTTLHELVKDIKSKKILKWIES